LSESGNNKTIIARDLTKKFGDFTAVDRINFQVNRGEIFSFLGPNGSGKTTTIRMLLGLIKPTSGSAEVLGEEMNQNPELIRPQVGYMSQRFSLYNDLTVKQNLVFYGRVYGLSNDMLRERIQEAVQMAGLEGHEHTKTAELSGGWRQRLALGAAILHRPELIFLDEPTAGVDPVSRREFWELLYELVSGGVTIFATTHYMDEAEHSHRLAFIQRGRIIAIGTPEQIKSEKMKGQVLEIGCREPEQALALLRSEIEKNNLSFEDVSLYGALIHVVATDIPRARSETTAIFDEAGIELDHMDEIEPSLEDVFIASMR
jgi:ABC-2 type transport system ATP-binding protein